METFNPNSIRVLWIEDEKEKLGFLTEEAKSMNVILDNYPNLESGMEQFDAHFNEYEAIILDAHCKVYEDSPASDDFLYCAWAEIKSIFTKHHSIRPCYILTAGPQDGRIDSKTFVRTIERMKKWQNDYALEFGEMVYYKTGDSVNQTGVSVNQDKETTFDNNINILENPLLNQIKKVCGFSHHWPAMARHRDTLCYLGPSRLFKGSARQSMIELLSALYEPNKYNGFRFNGNPIRKVFEAIVHTCVENGIIPEQIRSGGNVQCREASRFLSGENPERLSVRFGYLKERILDSTESSILLAILASTNVASHESSEDLPETDIVLTDDNRDEFAGSALLMCRIIKAIGKYISRHSNANENKQMWKPNPSLLEGCKCKVKKEGVILYAENCLLPINRRLSAGDTVILYDVVFNRDETSDEFPFYCKNPQTPKRKKSWQ